MRSIYLDQLHVMASIGILEHELLAKQPLVVSVSVEIAKAPLLPERDDVSCVLDYRHLRDAVLFEVEHGHINMLETLAGRVCARLLAHAVVDSVCVRVDKPNIFPDCTSVGIEVSQRRSGAVQPACGAPRSAT